MFFFFFFFAAEGGFFFFFFFFKLSLCKGVLFFFFFFFQCYALFSFIMRRKHGSESVCKTESFESFFVHEMTHRGLKCVTLVPVCHLIDKK